MESKIKLKESGIPLVRNLVSEIRNPRLPWITLCGAKSSSGCLETSERGYSIDRRKRVEILRKSGTFFAPPPFDGIFFEIGSFPKTPFHALPGRWTE